MKTKVLNSHQLGEAAYFLLSGEIVAFPTETVFGLGVVYDNEESFKKLIEVKHRPENKLFTLMVADLEDIAKYAVVTPLIQKVIDNFMVGPLTIILPAKEDVPHYVKGDNNEIGIRISSLAFVRKLIRETGKPLLVPSANKTGEPPALNDKQALKIFDGEIAAVIEGQSRSHIPSTVVRINDKITLIRQGAISLEEILEKVEEEQ